MSGDSVMEPLPSLCQGASQLPFQAVKKQFFTKRQLCRKGYRKSTALGPGILPGQKSGQAFAIRPW